MSAHCLIEQASKWRSANARARVTPTKLKQLTYVCPSQSHWAMNNENQAENSFFSIMRVNDFMKATIVLAREQASAKHPTQSSKHIWSTCTHIVQRARARAYIVHQFKFHVNSDNRKTHTRTQTPNKCKHVRISSKCLSKFVSLCPHFFWLFLSVINCYVSLSLSLSVYVCELIRHSILKKWQHIKLESVHSFEVMFSNLDPVSAST